MLIMIWQYNTKALDTIQKLFQYFENFPVNHVAEIIVNLHTILSCFQVNYSHIFNTYDAVHINQNWAVNNAAIIFRPKPSKIETRPDFLLLEFERLICLANVQFHILRGRVFTSSVTIFLSLLVLMLEVITPQTCFSKPSCLLV